VSLLILSYSKELELRYNADVIVAGGGPAGFAAAVMCARQGRSVILVEQSGSVGGASVLAGVAEFMNFDDGILYEHNIEAYKKLMEAIARKGKACAIHSTGTGKMYLALKWLLDNRGESFAYVAPTNVILDKFLDIVIDTCFKDKVDVFEKCNSIESKAKKVSELFGNSDIHLLTYQGLHEKMKNGKKEVLVNHIVLDEFHHCGADQWGSSVEKFIKTNNQTELIGLSATPIRNDGVDMVDELFQKSNEPVPQQLATLKGKTPRFTGVAKKEDMKQVVFDMLGI